MSLAYFWREEGKIEETHVYLRDGVAVWHGYNDWVGGNKLICVRCFDGQIISCQP